MKMDRRGVTALPIKLLIISIILTLSFPIIIEAFESNEREVNAELMDSEARKVMGAATSVYYSMNGATRMVEVEVPDGCTMILGGEGDDAYGIHMYQGGEMISQQWLDKPILSFSNVTFLTHPCVLSITTEGKSIEVTVS